MSEFSIEKEVENIYNQKTKEYFKEVYSSYCSGNFRSAVVMLYSVVLCDLIYKLQELRDRYSDGSAKKILEEINDIKEKNDKSPDWETKLIEFVDKRTSFFEGAACENILHLQKHRHLSAHPVLDQIDLLFSPNKETVRSHVRNMLEGILTRPPIFSKKVVEELVNDLSRNKDIFLSGENSDLKKYLEAKYFKNLSPNIENAIFKALWKFIFIIKDNENCDENRAINFKALKIIFKNKKTEYLKLIKDESPYFSNVARGDSLMHLIVFISENSEIYNILTDEAREIIKGGIDDNDNIYILSWFIEDNFSEHIKKIYQRRNDKPEFSVKQKAFENLHNISVDLDCGVEVLELGIFLFEKSFSFSKADDNFDKYIFSYLDKYDKKLFEKLFDVIESNDQIHGRNKMIADSKKIRESVDKVLGIGFDYDRYPKFMENYNYYLSKGK